MLPCYFWSDWIVVDMTCCRFLLWHVLLIFPINLGIGKTWLVCMSVLILCLLVWVAVLRVESCFVVFLVCAIGSLNKMNDIIWEWHTHWFYVIMVVECYSSTIGYSCNIPVFHGCLFEWFSLIKVIEILWFVIRLLYVSYVNVCLWLVLIACLFYPCYDVR